MKSADMQTWVLNKRLRWQQAKWGTGAFLATSTFALAWHCYATGIEGSGIAFGTASLSFLIFATTWNFPRIVQRLPIDWANRYPFNDARLQDLKDYLNRLADSERSVMDANGVPIDRDILKREWALLFLTSNAKLHAIPSFAGIDTDLASSCRPTAPISTPSKWPSPNSRLT